MSAATRVNELLLRWEEARLDGQSLSPEELCCDCPDLLEAVRRGIAALEALSPVLDSFDASTLERPPQAEAGSEPPEGSRYRPVRFHARGGLGEVWLAHDAELHRDVALKSMRRSGLPDPDGRRRFLREAEITARLEHPGIVPVYGMVSGADGRPAYAMRFIEGETFKEAIARFHAAEEPGRDPGERALALRQLLARFVAACNAVAYAHSKGIVHRDLKPANIMLGKFGETLVVDWGLARPFGGAGDAGQAVAGQTVRPGDTPPEGTILGAAIGTPGYMAPEQAEGRWDVVGPRTDVYSLGATLYTILTGQSPLDGDDPHEALVRTRNADFPAPRRVKADVPPALEAVCLKAMARRPEDRYLSADALAGEVEHWLADEPVRAWREPLLTRLHRWARRRRTLVVTTTVALLILTVGSALGLFLYQRGEQRRQELARKNLTDRASAAHADLTLGINELKAGRYDRAEAIFAQAARSIEDEPALADEHDQLTRRHEQARRLVGFYRHSQRAERLMTHDLDQEAAREFEAGLEALAIRAEDKWWEQLPDEDFEPEQAKRLRRDVHLHWLLLAGVRGRRGLVESGNPAANTEGCRSALVAGYAAERYQPSFAGKLLIAFCKFNLGEMDGVPDLVAGQPKLSVDYFLIGILNFWVKFLPDDPLSRLAFDWADRLHILDRRDPWGTAERHLRTATSLDPQHYWSYYWLGEVLEAQGKHAEAELVYGACIQNRPDWYDGYLKRGLTVLQQARLAPDRPRADALAARAFADFDAAVRIDPNDYYPVGVRGYARALRGDYVRAIEDFTKAIDRPPAEPKGHPHFFGTYAHRAAAYAKLGRHTEAVADFTQALELYPRQIQGARWRIDELYFARGQSYLALGKAAEAADDFTATLKQIEALPPSSPDRRHDLALCRAARGQAHFLRRDWNACLADCEQALRQDPNCREACSWHGQACAERAGMGDLPRAVADFRRAAALAPGQLDAWEQLARACLKAGDRPGYRRACAELLNRLGPSPDAETLRRAIWTCVLVSDAEVSQLVLLSLANQMAMGRQDGAALRVLGAVQLRVGNHEKAKTTLAQAEAAGVDHPALTRLLLAMAHQHLKEMETASRLLEQARPEVDGSSALPWDERLELALLAAEARALVGGRRSEAAHRPAPHPRAEGSTLSAWPSSVRPRKRGPAECSPTAGAGPWNGVSEGTGRITRGSNMTQIEAIYQGGVFRPLGEVHLAENQRVTLTVQPAEPEDARSWLARMQQFQREFIAKHGCLPDSTPDIAEDRMRDV